MNQAQSMVGRWLGTYAYTDAEFGALRVGFEIVIRESVRDGKVERFTGTVTDDPAYGMPDPGTIRGARIASELFFVKQMPVSHVSDHEGRSLKLSSCAREAGFELEVEPTHPPIVYEGEITPHGEATGTWIIEADPYVSASGFSLDSEVSRGTWQMRREGKT